MHHLHNLNGYSRFEFIVFRDLLMKFDFLINKFTMEKASLVLPSFFLYFMIFFFEVCFPSFLFIILYILLFNLKKYYWKELFMLKTIQLFLIEPLFSPLCFLHMSIYWVLCNVDFYNNYFLYDDCIICFEKTFMGVISQCCPYVRLCHSCQKKMSRCPICKN